MSFNLNSLPADLKGRVSLVTGGSRGIGRGIAEKLASLGSNIVINYVSNEKAAHETVAHIKSTYKVDAIAVKGDVSVEADAKNLVDATIKHFKQLNVVINNAGVFLGAAAHEETVSQYDKMFNINVKGTFLVTRSAIPHLKENDTIVNVSSTITHGPFPGVTVYTATKGAIESYTRALAVELGPKKIRVNTISPGYTESDMLASGGEALAKVGAEASLFKRLGSPGDIAEGVAFLAVPRSGAWMTGQNLISGGGVAFAF